jgi:hypothetical protein
MEQGWVPHDLLRSLALSGGETVEYCIRRMADPDLPASEAACLVRLLQKAEMIPKMVDALLTIDRKSARAAVTVLGKTERELDLRLVAHLQSENPGLAMRSLELLEVIDMSKRLVPILFGLLSHKDPKIQSKASLVVQKVDDDYVYTRRLLQHSDARVRANAIQGIADRADERSLVYLRRGAEDPDHRARSQAAVGLCRIGDPAGKQILLRMIQDPNAVERRSATWAMGSCGALEDVLLLEQVARSDQDERVRELAEQGLQRIRERAAKLDMKDPP